MLSKCSNTELQPFKKVAYYTMNIFRCLKMYIKVMKIQNAANQEVDRLQIQKLKEASIFQNKETRVGS